MEPGLNSSASGKQNLGTDTLLSTWSDRKEAMEKKVAFLLLLATLHLHYCTMLAHKVYLSSLISSVPMFRFCTWAFYRIS